MKSTSLLTFIIAGCCISACASQRAVGTGRSALEDTAVFAVMRRIDAYNRHDLEAYLAAHQTDVRIYRYPDREIGRGRDHLRRIFAPTFEQKVGKVEVLAQFVVQNTVVSHERLVSVRGRERLVTIYTVSDGQIASIRLIVARE